MISRPYDFVSVKQDLAFVKRDLAFVKQEFASEMQDLASVTQNLANDVDLYRKSAGRFGRGREKKKISRTQVTE